MGWVFIFAVAALAHSTPSYASHACGETADTATMLACINRDLSVADDELDTLYDALLDEMQHWDGVVDVSAAGFESRPNATVTVPNERGLEFILVSGNASLDGEELEAQNWGRLPAGQALKATAGPQGALIWFKDAPLLHDSVRQLPGESRYRQWSLLRLAMRRNP